MTKTEVVRYFGSQRKLAQALTEAGHRISQAAICQWGESVPEHRAYQIERMTDGKLKASPEHIS